MSERWRKRFRTSECVLRLMESVEHAEQDKLQKLGLDSLCAS